MNDRIYLTPEEAAALLGVCRSTLRKMTAPKGPIKAIRLSSRCTRYLRQDLETWMAKKTVKPKQED